MSKKVRKFNNDLDNEVTSLPQQIAASNETLIQKLEDHEDEDVQELVRRFNHALECLAQPNLYHRVDVENFVRGHIPTLFPRIHKDLIEEIIRPYKPKEEPEQ